MAKLMKPLFIDGDFNKDNKRIRVNYLKTVGDYPLWVEDGKPNKDYTKNPLDRYYIYIQIGDYIFSCGETEYNMVQRVGYNKMVEELYQSSDNRDSHFDGLRKNKTYEESNLLVKEQIGKEQELIDNYGQKDEAWAEYLKENINRNIKRWIDARDNNGTFADFIGALALNELEKCQEIASILRVKRDEENRLKREQREIERKEKEEKELQEEKLLTEEVKSALVNGGTIKNSDIIVKLADEHNVDIPIRTRGWMLNDLTEVTITEEGNISYRYWKRSKNAKGSQKVWDVLSELRSKIARSA